MILQGLHCGYYVEHDTEGANLGVLRCSDDVLHDSMSHITLGGHEKSNSIPLAESLDIHS